MAHRIRSPLPEDTETLLLLAESTGLFRPGEVAELLGDTLTRYFAGHLGAARVRVLVRTDASESPVGWAYLEPKEIGEWELVWLGVDPRWHRQKFGSALLLDSEQEAMASGGCSLVICTSNLPATAAARSLYERHGYSMVGQVADFYGPGDAKVEYRKVLSPSLPRRRVVWLSGNSGAGKSFIGDYLAGCAGFHHVDGDAPARGDAAQRQLFARFAAAFESWFDERAAPRELWVPYYQQQVDLVLAALRVHSDVVVSLSVYHREARDFLREKLPTHIFLQLCCTPTELLRRARVRFSEYASIRGQTFAEAWERSNGLAPGSFTDAAFESKTMHIMRGLQPLQADERETRLYFDLDVTRGNPWAELHARLGLTPADPNQPVPTDEIAAINYQRFKEL